MIEELRRFILVAQSGNVSKTAEKIFITQSALSQSIKRLEKELGTKLFIHKGKTLQITPQGKAIVEIGSKIIELWEKAKDPKVINIQQPNYLIGLFDGAALRLGKYFMGNKTNPFELTIGASGNLLTQLSLGTIDIAICVIDTKTPTPKDFVLLKTFTEELFPVIASKTNHTLEEMPFILYNKGSHTRNQIDDVFRKNGIVPNIIVESTSVSFMKKLALLGSGVALLPQSYVETELKQGVLKKQKLSIEFKREFGLFILRNGKIEKDDPIIKELIGNLSN